MRETPQGTILPVKVTPNARTDQLTSFDGTSLKVKVSAPPDKGRANIAVVKLLSKTLDIPQSKIVLIRGATSRLKEFLLENENLTQTLNFLNNCFIQ